jgi:hypothetical protein
MGFNMIQIGQIYEYTYNSSLCGETIKILDINIQTSITGFLPFRSHIVELLKCAPIERFSLKTRDGHTIYDADSFEIAVQLGWWKLLSEAVIGATCTKCKQHFPYADYATDFKCWGCKNKF